MKFSAIFSFKILKVSKWKNFQLFHHLEKLKKNVFVTQKAKKKVFDTQKAKKKTVFA